MVPHKIGVYLGRRQASELPDEPYPATTAPYYAPPTCDLPAQTGHASPSFSASATA